MCLLTENVPHLRNKIAMVPTSAPLNALKKHFRTALSKHSLSHAVTVPLHICMVLHVAKNMDDFATQACHSNGLRYFYGDASEQALTLCRVPKNTLHSFLIQL
jgi:hypothetical protein